MSKYKTCAMGFCDNQYNDVNVNNPKSNRLCPSCRVLLRDVSKEERGARSFAKWVGATIGRIRNRANEKGRECTITPDDVYRIWPSDNKCPMMGIPFKTGGTHGRERHNSPSIDRIDNERGYTPDNIQVVCMLFNGIKSYYSDEELDKFAISWLNSRFNFKLKESEDE